MKKTKTEIDHYQQYEKTVSKLVEQIKSGLIAKRDFAIHFNNYHLEIKTGDDLSTVPEMFLENLKTEKVI